MGFWAGIKHALNSTLGTKDFKPLDKLNYDAIKSQRSLYASDEVHWTLKGFDTKTTAPDGDLVITSSQKILTYSSGSIKLKMYYKFFNHNGGSFLVYRNNVVETFVPISGNGDYETSITSNVINYEKGDVITWEVRINQLSSFYFTSSKVEILGTLTEYSPLDISQND